MNPRGPFMTDSDWKRVKFFSPKENWGNWRKVHRDLILAIDSFRAFVGRKVVIHCAFELQGHTDGSFHGKGLAADLHVEDMHVLDMFFAATRFDEFGGIGVYPFWNNPGLHVDIRPHSSKFEPDSRWMRTKAGVYVPLSWENLKEALNL